MNKPLGFLCVTAFLVLATAGARGDASLKLLPAPKEVALCEGRFVLTAATRILMSRAEDRVAAETLQEEIRERSGLRIAIEVSTPLHRAGDISLARLDDRSLRAHLEADGLRAGPELGAQGYILRVTPGGAILAASSAQGVFYAAQTFRQLLHAEDNRLFSPAVAIRDWPSMMWRGVQDDISRGPIPTLEYMKKQVRTLAAYKVNLFGLYMEHVFDFSSQPLITPREASLTAAEIRDLVVYAQKYFVTILPEQQAFGHLHQVLKYEKYSELAETPHGHVLVPGNDQSYEFIQSLYAELVPLFPGPFLHIGADETLELGRGKTKARAEQVGLGRVYLEHLQRVSTLLQPYHKRLMFWGDIAVKYPELLHVLPKEMIAIPWDYEPRPQFDPLLQPFKDAGLGLFVAPGAINWKVIWPDLDTAYVNIRNFVRDGQRYQALGMLNTTWDDDGETLFEMTWPALAFGAAAGWQPGESSIEDFKNSFDWSFYRNEGSIFRDALEQLDRAHKLLASVGLENASNDLFWVDPFSEAGAHAMKQGLPVARDLRLAAESALESLYRNRGQAKLHNQTVDALIFAALRLDALGMKMQLTQEINQFYWDAYLNQTDDKRVERDLDELTDINTRPADLRDSTTRLRELYEQAWLRENRRYWLGNVLVRYDRLAQLYEGKMQAVRAARFQYDAQKVLPAPQTLGFYLQP
jgi:hexosaminidase